jgi:hypothetical protein
MANTKFYHVSRSRLVAVGISASVGPLAYFSLKTGPDNVCPYKSQSNLLVLQFPGNDDRHCNSYSSSDDMPHLSRVCEQSKS